MRLRISWRGGREPAPAESGPDALRDASIEAASLSDAGCQRELNEDSVRLVAPGGRNGQEGWLAVVADGMGGHQAGEVASSVAAEVVCREYAAGTGSAAERLERALRAANAEIYAQSASRQSLGGMGTTCTALALDSGRAWAAHVGDSRIYLVRGDAIYRMTEDHSAVMDLVKKGILSADQARRHTERNVLLRAMGHKETLEVDVWREEFPVQPGDRFVLCSDGLHDPVDDEEIRDAALRLDPGAACAELVRLARERGGYDNISVVVLRARSESEANP